jgi:hypothetical protein
MNYRDESPAHRAESAVGLKAPVAYFSGRYR